jgi:preprotein translocase subunit SecG
LFTILITIHVFVAIGLIISVLMQSSKGEGLAGAFGGGGVSGAVFGGRGAAPFLSKATTVLAITFMVMCILLTLVSSGSRQSTSSAGSAVQDYAREQSEQVTPADVQEINVGQGAAESQGELPVRVVPTDQQPTQNQGSQTDQQPDEGSGG